MSERRVIVEMVSGIIWEGICRSPVGVCILSWRSKKCVPKKGVAALKRLRTPG